MNNLNLNFYLIHFSVYYFIYLKLPFSSKEENINLLNSNEEIRAEYGNWLQVCQKGNNKCVGVQFALNVDGNRAARFIIERLKKILIIWLTH